LYWNVDVKGMPVARIYLKDQPKPDETRAVFISPQYFHGVSGGIAKIGLESVLKQINVCFWINKIEQSKLVQKLC
jgi:hypothetical protein